MTDTMIPTIKGVVTLSTYVNGVRLSVSGQLSLYEMEVYPDTLIWLFGQMDHELYDAIGFIPRDRTWEVLPYDQQAS